eukprot:11245334-Karenia_brevis.AAC.1
MSGDLDRDALHLELLGDLEPSSWEGIDSSDGGMADSEAGHSSNENNDVGMEPRQFAAVTLERPEYEGPAIQELDVENQFKLWKNMPAPNLKNFLATHVNPGLRSADCDCLTAKAYGA